MHVDDNHVVAEAGVHLEGQAVVHAPEGVGAEMDGEADFGERGVIVALEGVEVVGAHLGGAVAAPEIVLKEDSHLLHHRFAVDRVDGSGDLEGCDEVFLAVGAHLADGELRTGDYHRFAQVFKHKRQGGGSICHGVGAVKHYESVESVVVFADSLCYLLPVLGLDVARVDGRVKLSVLDVEIEHFYFWHIVDEVVEVERAQRRRGRILDHADSASGVYNEYARTGIACRFHLIGC